MLLGGRFAVLKFFAVLLAVGLLAFAAVACNGGGNGDETPRAGETPTEGETPQVGTKTAAMAAIAQGCKTSEPWLHWPRVK